MPDHDKTSTLPHTRLHSTRFVRLLRELGAIDRAAATGDVAEQLSRWFGVADAIALHAVLHRAAAPRVGETAPAGNAIAAEVARERQVLQQLIASACSSQGVGRIRFPAPTLVMTGVDGVGYQPLLAFHRAVQRELEPRIGVLHDRARRMLVRTASSLQPLAALDEAMDHALSPRAAALLSEIPALLEGRFTRLHDDHRQSLAGAADDAAAWLQPGGWLARFRDDVHDLLQAELDLRLQPVLGLAAAAHQELALFHE